MNSLLNSPTANRILLEFRNVGFSRNVFTVSDNSDSFSSNVIGFSWISTISPPACQARRPAESNQQGYAGPANHAAARKENVFQVNRLVIDAKGIYGSA